MLDFTELSVCSVLSLQPPHHVVELIEAAVADGERAAAVAVLDGDAEAERVGEALLQRQRVGILRALRARFAIFFCALPAGLANARAISSTWRTLRRQLAGYRLPRPTSAVDKSEHGRRGPRCPRGATFDVVAVQHFRYFRKRPAAGFPNGDLPTNRRV